MNSDRVVRLHQMIDVMTRQYEVPEGTSIVMAVDIDKVLTFCVREGEDAYKHVVSIIERFWPKLLPLTIATISVCILEYERQRAGIPLVGS